VAPQVADEGGGIKRSGMPRIWTYLYTTSESPLSMMDDAFDGADSPTVMAGYGVGLPISRLYARYFGGDLNITSMEVRLGGGGAALWRDLPGILEEQSA